MTISTTDSRISYNGNGVTTVFSFPYRFLANGDIVVVSVSSTGVETVKTLTTDYTLTGAGDDAGGSVTMLVAPASGTRLIIYRDTDIVQETDYISGDPFPAETHERALDRLTMIAQEIGSGTDRSIKVPVGDSSSLSTVLPAAANRLDKFIVFDATTGETGLSTVTQTQVASAVAAAYAAGSTADAVTFIQAGTGAVSRSVQSKLREDSVSVTDFGAVGDGTTDNAAAFQLCINYCQANNRDMFIPQGNYNCLSGVSITSSIKIRGEGRYLSLVKFTGGTLTGFTVNTPDSVEFHSMWIYGVTPGASNCAVSLTGSGSGNFSSLFRDVLFDAWYDPIITLSAYGWTIENCSFNDWTHNGVSVANALAPDAGDSTITTCLFSNAGASARAVFQSSSGGLRVKNCKFNGGAYGYLMDLSSGVSTSILIVEGCSFENQTTAGIRMLNTAGSGGFSQVLIDGNQFYNQPTPIALDDGSAFILGAVISDNIIVCASGASTTSAITATAVPRVSIDDNVIYGSGSTVVGITIGSASTDAQEGNNLIFGCATPVSKSNTITAAAGVLTVPLGDDVFKVNNVGGNITSISPVQKGRTIRLMFTGVLTVTDGSNLKMAGNFVTTADDTITLTCYDGTNWFEDGRSVN